MQLLESAMAFAVTMIIFSTITTGIVELLLRSLGTREKYLEKTIRALFQTVVWPRMKAPLMASAKTAEAALKEKLGGEFVRAMTGNPLSDVSASGFPVRKDNQVSELSILAFAERLGRTDIGKAILDEGEVQLDLLVKDFVRTFDRFARASHEIFRKRAQRTAMAVGIIFALTANVDAGQLFITLMDNPDLRTGLIDQAEEAAEANKAAAQQLADLTTELEKGGLSEEQSAEIKAKIDEISADVKALEASGLPVGHSFYPYCRGEPEADTRCSDSASFWEGAVKFLQWLSLSVLAGILIGLGGPFWFRVFSSLSQIFQLLRSLGIGRGGKAANAQGADARTQAEPLPEDTAKPTSVVDAFKVAVQVHTNRAGSGQRMVLRPDGQPL